jgi:hypothetical protein
MWKKESREEREKFFSFWKRFDRSNRPEKVGHERRFFLRREFI